MTTIEETPASLPTVRAAPLAAFSFPSAEIAIVIALGPFFLFPGPGSLLALPVIVTVLWVTGWRSTGAAISPTPFNRAFLLLAATVAISLYATYDITVSTPKVAGVIYGLIVFFALVRRLTDRRSIVFAAEAFAVAGSGLAIIALLGTSWIDKVPALAPITGRIPALIRGVPGQMEGFQPNAIAGALILFLPLQIARLFASWGESKGPIRRVLLAICTAVTAATIVLTQSRAGWLSIMVAFVVWACWRSVRTRRLLAFAAAIAAMALIFGWNAISATAVDALGAGLRNDAAGRLELWSRAVAGIGDFPLTGMGMNTFRYVMPVLYPTFITPQMDVAHAHNHLLQVTLDLGLFGLIAYLAVWIIAGRLLVRTRRVSADPAVINLVDGLAAALMGYFAFGTVDAIPLGAKVGVFFWIALALVSALHRAVVDQAPAATSAE